VKFFVEPVWKTCQPSEMAIETGDCSHEKKMEEIT